MCLTLIKTHGLQENIDKYRLALYFNFLTRGLEDYSFRVNLSVKMMKV